MILDRLGILRFVFRGSDQAAAAVSRRWRRAYDADPALATDLIHLGGVLALREVRIEGGEVQPDPIDPYDLAYEQGQRDMAVKLLSVMGITPYELNQLLEADHGR